MSEVRTEHERSATLRIILERPLPFRVKVSSGGRSLDQNALAFRWYGEIYRRGREFTTDQARNFCKYHFGCPIRAAAEPEFAAFLELLESRYGYEELVPAMKYVEVTRHFDVGQMSEYLTAVQAHFLGRGILLTGLDRGEGRYPEAAA